MFKECGMRFVRPAWILAGCLFIHCGTAMAGDEPPEFILQWGSNGIGEGEFSGPHGIEVDDGGDVYVVDTGNNRVQKFTSDGVFLITWGSLGAGPGDFNHPHGVGIGPDGTQRPQ